ncbi:MAG TPA: alpha/beta hydrolase [Ramlibacter sp.]|nr:alpha/beta hydrolase [Ramlibacter sp.]
MNKQETQAAPDGAWLDRMYNNRGLVPEFASHLERWATQSRQAREAQPCELDLRYGEGEKETLDVFPTTQGRKGGPVLFFIHGGYWRALDKSDKSFVAPAFTAQGATVVVPNYALCPAVTVPQIVVQMARALAWTWRNAGRYGADPGRIVVAGHSAGGHLAAMMLACLWQQLASDLPRNLVKGSLSISGLYDLAPLMHTPFLQPDLQLTPEQVRQASPSLLPPPAQGRLYSVVGGDESAEFQRQNGLIRRAWGLRRVPVCESLPGLNHFSVLEALVQPGHRLNQLTQRLLAVA